MKGKLEAVGITVGVLSFPEGIKDANELLVSRNGDAGEVFLQILNAATVSTPKPPSSPESVSVLPSRDEKTASGLELVRDGVTYHARVHSLLLGRLRATVKATKAEAFHVDTIDLYASRSRTEYAKRAAKGSGWEPKRSRRLSWRSSSRARRRPRRRRARASRSPWR